MIRRDRACARLRTSSLAPVTLIRGDRRCKGSLIDFSPANCAVRVHDPAFHAWSIEDLRLPVSITLHGETRGATIVRLQRTRSATSDNWIVGMVLR